MSTIGTSGKHAGVLARSLQSGRWMALNMAGQKALNFVTFLILARILTPRDYGLIAIGLMVIGILDTFSTPGFERAVLQSSGDGLEYLDVIWTFNVLKGAALFVLSWFAAPLIARFFSAPDGVSVLRCLGAVFFIQGLHNVAQVYFQKDLDFKKVFIRDIVSQSAYILVAVPWALISPSVWALAAGHVARFCASCAATYVLHPYRPRLSFDFRRLKALVPFTGWVMAMSVWSYVASVLDNVVVGGWLGPAALGLYSKGREIAYLPASPIANVVSKVSLSAYARLQHDRAKVQAGFLKALDLALLLALPFTALMIAQGDGIIAVALGAKWSGLVRPLQALCAAMVFRCLIEVTLPALEGLGRPDLRLRCELVQGIIALTLLYPAIRWHGALGAALAMTIATAAAWVYSADVARREFGVTLRAVASASWLPAACSLPLLLSRAAIDAGQLSRIGYATSLAAVAAGSAGLFFSVGAALGTGGYMTVRDLGARWSS